MKEIYYIGMSIGIILISLWDAKIDKDVFDVPFWASFLRQTTLLFSVFIISNLIFSVI